MEIRHTLRSKKSIKRLRKAIQLKFEKQAQLLISNPNYPSLHAKKYDKERGIWQARIDRSYRFYFLVRKGFYILLDITKHKK